MKNVVISLKKMKKKKKILNYIVLPFCLHGRAWEWHQSLFMEVGGGRKWWEGWALWMVVVVVKRAASNSGCG